MKTLLALALFLVACGGGAEPVEPDAGGELGTCGVGDWDLILTAGAGDCTTPGDKQGTTIIVDETSPGVVAMSVYAQPNFLVTGTVTRDGTRCRLEASLYDDEVSGPNGETGTENDDISLVESGGNITGSGTSEVAGGFSCTQALTFSGTFTATP
jgi:hypothetical protein